MNKIIQLICPDQKGIIAQITSIINNSNGNIISIEQYVDNENNNFYIRLVVDNQEKAEFPKKDLVNLAIKLNGKINIFDLEKKMNVAILGTKESEPIYTLFIKYATKALCCNNPILIINHNKLKFIAKQFNANFYKINNNNQILRILKKEKIDLIILARYMQIIPDNIVNLYQNNIINIHHSFLPAFKGAKPYHQAYKKGVKIIGATGHYVTKKLDEGPIIAQDVVNISHSHSIKDIIQLGRGIEKTVLYKCVKAHLDYKIITNKNKTIVFK
jgi:formyltetrahydrofolate deformylase